MCLAYPGKIVKIASGMALVDYGSEKREARIVEGNYAKGDFVIVQGKIVVEKIPRRQAVEWLETMKSGKI